MPIFLKLLTVLLALGCGQGVARAYPSKPVTIIIPFAAGGQLDVIGRPLADHLSRALGQPFIIEAKPGAGGLIGATYVAKAEPDGHTLLLGTTSTFSIAPAITPKLAYNPLSFQPVALFTESPMVLLANSKHDFHSAADIIAFAKSNPGKLTYSSAGAGTPPHLGMEYFLRLAGISAIHVPYRGGAPAMQDLIAGQVDLMLETMTNSMSFIDGGSAIPILVSSPQRLPRLPDVPTAGEAGFKEFLITSWTALVAPARTPASIVEALNRAVNEQLAKPEFVNLLNQVSSTALGGAPSAFGERVQREISIWSSLKPPETSP